MKPLDDAVLRTLLDPVPAEWPPPSGALREAAVLAPLFTRVGRDFLLYTRRRADLPHHPGQISFPGGMREDDESPLVCALRESREEIGLPPESVTVLGGLPPRPSVAGFQVQVVVARIPADVELIPDPSEVAAICAFPLADLRDPGRWQDRVPESVPGARPSPHFEYGGEVLWGLTAQFTLDFLERLAALP